MRISTICRRTRLKRRSPTGWPPQRRLLAIRTRSLLSSVFPISIRQSAAEERAEQLGLSIWSADVHGSDWTFITAEKVTALSLSRLEAKKKGILLLHDIHDRTAKALPVLLRELKKRGYRIVHVVPASGAVAKIEEKPDAKTPAKTEQTAVASSDEKTPAKTERGGSREYGANVR